MKKFLPVVAAVLTAVAFFVCGTPAFARNETISAARNKTPPSWDKYCHHVYYDGWDVKHACRWRDVDITNVPFPVTDYEIALKTQRNSTVPKDSLFASEASALPMRSLMFNISGPGIASAELPNSGAEITMVMQIWNETTQDWEDINTNAGALLSGNFADYLSYDFVLGGNIDLLKNAKVRGGVRYDRGVSGPAGYKGKPQPHYIFLPAMTLTDCFDPAYFDDDSYTLSKPHVCGEPVAPPDVDVDGIADATDNCPHVSNPLQADLDSDGIGDDCDDDVDADGVKNSSDNCPLVSNADQLNSNGNDKGDVCEDDNDVDGTNNDKDNCPDVFNDQADMDHDGLGDKCDPDVDGDGVVDTSDNCLDVANPGQEDIDGDGFGNACDATDNRPTDKDGDSITDEVDNCPAMHNVGQADLDKDGIGDACDDDIDGDGIARDFDNCPVVANPGQEDLDSDGLGDVCDTIDNSITKEVDPPVEPTDDASGEGGCSLNPQAAAASASLWIWLIAALPLVALRRRK